jgi:TatD DNase family protein
VTPAFIDTHSHLHFGAYDKDRDAVLLRMREKNVWTVTVGTNAVTSKGAIALAEREPDVFASVGFHPGDLTSLCEDEYEETDPNPYSLESMNAIAHSSNRVVAIGEIGLDYRHIDPNLDQNEAKNLQKRVFTEQICLANDLNLPIIIHYRDAFDDLIRLLQDLIYDGTPLNGVVHCFAESWERAEALLDIGLYLSFTGIITFKPRKSDDPEQHVHRVIERMPLDRIMVETDAPWLAPEPFRGKRNEPAYVEQVSDKIAELRGVSPEEIARATTENAMRFFGLDHFGKN